MLFTCANDQVSTPAPLTCACAFPLLPCHPPWQVATATLSGENASLEKKFEETQSAAEDAEAKAEQGADAGARQAAAAEPNKTLHKCGHEYCGQKFRTSEGFCGGRNTPGFCGAYNGHGGNLRGDGV